MSSTTRTKPIEGLQLRVSGDTLRKLFKQQWSFSSGLTACPVKSNGSREAGSLGQVRQVPLIPCRESFREHPIARPEEYILASQYWLGQSWSLFENWRSSDLPESQQWVSDSSVWLLNLSFELQPLSMMMSGSSIKGES